MDSGAFSVHHSGKTIDIDEYIEFINNTPKVNLFATLDEIPFPELNSATASKSAETTWNNYCYMLKHVKPEYRDKIVPVYHFGEPVSYIHKIIDGVDGYKPNYMAFGGRGLLCQPCFKRKCLLKNDINDYNSEIKINFTEFL